MHTHTTSTCGEAGSDVHAPTQKLAIRRVEHKSEIRSNESRYLAERKEVARLRWRFSFDLRYALSFRTRHHLCRQDVAFAGTQHLRSQGPVSVHARCTEAVTKSEGREGANGDGNRVGGGNEDGDEGGKDSGDGDKAGTGTGGGDERTRARREREREQKRKRGKQWRRERRRKKGTGTGAETGMRT